MAILHDRATISGKAKITREGYFVADALVARANNVQDYRAAELGLADRAPNDVIRVFRPEAEVFAVDSLKSAGHLPITLDHPPHMVDANNWRDYAKGQTDGEVLRDGEFLRVPLRITDADAVDSVLKDRQEFSLGYQAEIRLESGSWMGQDYDAVASNFRYNHLAACRAARGGPELRIVDERPAEEPPVKIVLVDGLPVNVADASAAEATLNKILADRDAAVVDLRAAQSAVVAKDAEITAKDAKIAELEAAKPTPAQLRDAAAAFGRTVEVAKALGATITDEMDEAAVVRAAVTVKMGDKAANYTDEQARTAFDVLAAQPTTTPPVGDALRNVIGDGPANLADAGTAFADARAKRFNRLSNNHRGTAANAA